MDYFNIVLSGWYQGLPGLAPVEVYGPGDRGALPPISGTTDVPVVNPENPTPGTVDMTNYLTQAFATDINDRLRDSGKPGLDKLIRSGNARSNACASGRPIPGAGPVLGRARRPRRRRRFPHSVRRMAQHQAPERADGTDRGAT
ncbi:hypothetical protein [Rhodococcus wratislaviensis]|uniref:hypothetical protein n=1 Tax=Rhodococcus wratislaviensis TaxID=44752 RepID=UPI00365B4A47